MRAGVHSGPIALHEDGDISGVAVNVAARVLDKARPNEILSSEVLLDLVAAEEFAFTPRGEHELKGFKGLWPLYEVALTR